MQCPKVLSLSFEVARGFFFVEECLMLFGDSCQSSNLTTPSYCCCCSLADSRRHLLISVFSGGFVSSPVHCYLPPTG